MRTNKGSIYFFGPALMVQGYPDAHDLYTDLMAFFATLRPVKTNAIARTYPETTIADVRQVIDLLEIRARAADPSEPEARAAIQRWRAYVNTVAAAIKLSPLSSSAPFPDNDRLWTQEARRLAIRLSAERVTRPDEKTLAGSVADSANALPGRAVDVVTGGAGGASDAVETVAGKIGDAAGVVADAAETAASKVASAAKGIYKVADKHLPKLPSLPDPFGWARDMAREFKWPLIIGGAVLGGLVILPHLSDKKSASGGGR